MFSIRWALLKNKEDITLKEDNLLQQVCNQYSMLSACYELKEEFRTFFTITNIDKASAYIDYFITIVAQSGIPKSQTISLKILNVEVGTTAIFLTSD